MSHESRKIGFWSVFALVTGSQIGSGIFMLPANLAPYGDLSFIGWGISGLGAVLLALVFGQLCSWFPKTGGPHVYVKEAFGNSASFFAGWTYWVISWLSTPIVIIASVGYLTPIIGVHEPHIHLLLEITLLFLLTLLNLKGVKTAGHAEFFLTLLKIAPLFIMPMVALFFFNKENIAVDIATFQNRDITSVLSSVVLLTLWGFVGVESATTPAGSIENPSRTIPRAIIFGTLCVAILYFINSLGIMGALPGKLLATSKAPYADLAQVVFGGNWHLFISLVASIVCVGTLNAWILFSGQIALGLAQDNLFPSFFAKRNKNDAPVNSILISSLGSLILLILTSQENLSRQMGELIDFSVISFLFVYAISCCSFLKILFHKRQHNYGWFFCGIIAFLFCGWVIYETPWKTILIASLFTLSGLPLYIGRYQKILKSS